MSPAMALRIASEGDSAKKIQTVGRMAGVPLQVSSGGDKTPCGMPVPVLTLPDGSKIRHTNAILRRLGQMYDSPLTGSCFMEEGQIDSWLEWVALEVDHNDLEDTEMLESVCQALEAHLKSRTFIVGQRLTLADISAAISLKQPIEKVGMDALREKFPSVVRWLRTSLHAVDGAPPAKPPAKAAAEAPKEAAAGKGPAKAEAKPEGEKAEGASKKDDKKKAKEEEKRKKEEEKKRREEETKAAAAAKHMGPSLTQNDFETHDFGNLFIQSCKRTERTWTPVSKLSKDKTDQSVWVRARVHASRKQGNKLCFLTLRQDVATVQAVVCGTEMAGFAGALPDESVVDILAKVSVPMDKDGKPIEVQSDIITQKDVELSVEKIYCIGRSQTLPLVLADASRPETDYEKDPTLVRVGQDTRLDNRVIDLRTVANQAIFRIQSGVCTFFREFLLKQEFQEIHTPKLIGGASEGGADVFRVDYFEGNAYLAQSPQLYKQMALMTDMPRVFEIGPIFRSENSHTHRHMTEFTGLDMEMTFKDHYHEVLEILDGLFNHIFVSLNKYFRREIDAVRAQYPFEDLKWKHPCKRLTFAEAVNLLKEHGPAILEKRLKEAETDYQRGIIEKHLKSVRAHDIEEDISTEDEKILGQIMLEKYQEELYIIDKFPKDTRPFYTMPDPVDPRWTNAYDVFLRGEEITSGAQRIHDPKLLVEKVEAKGVAPESIQPYIDAFKYGSYPHGGAGIGMERVVMLFLKLNNIRKSSMFPRDPKRLTP